MTTFGDEMMSIISTAVASASVGTNLFLSSKSSIPGDDGPYATIVETTGPPPDYTQESDGPAYEYAMAQVLSRAQAYADARSFALLIYRALGKVVNQTIGDTFYLWIRPVTAIYDMGVDKSVGRATVAFRIVAYKRPS